MKDHGELRQVCIRGISVKYHVELTKIAKAKGYGTLGNFLNHYFAELIESENRK